MEEMMAAAGNRIYLLFLAALILLCGSCSSSPRLPLSAVPPRDEGRSDPLISPRSPAGAPAETALDTMRELRDAAISAFDANHPMEALQDLVGILALDGEFPAETDRERAEERGELVRSAEGTLTAIASRLTLEPADDWLSAHDQVAGKLRDLSSGSGLQPSVRLVINYDAGKAVVADAPIRFSFLEGKGELVSVADTDSYGRASTTVRSLSRVDRPIVIRAMLVVSSRGAIRPFPEVFRDFTYLPPNRTARLFALERPVGATEAAAGPSPLADAVSRGLSSTGLEITPVSMDVDSAVFGAVSEGKAPALTAALDGASYLIIALAEYDEPRQVVNRGRSFNIFSVASRARLRILRSDGSVVASRPVLTSVGRGGTAEAAIQAALAASRSAMEEDLLGAAAEIGRSLE
jgi:hypothetical protein